MEGRYYSSLGKVVRAFRTIAAAVLAAGLWVLFVICMSGCRSWKHNVTEKEDTKDSVRIEYKEKVVKVPVIVEVEVPVEQKERETRDSTSHLETKFAVSDAAIIWIDGVPFLRHTLANKPQKIQKQDSVPVVDKEKTVWKTRRVTYTKTEIREKRLTWWQKGLIWAGVIEILILVIVLLLWFYGGKAFLKKVFS